MGESGARAHVGAALGANPVLMTLTRYASLGRPVENRCTTT